MKQSGFSLIEMLVATAVLTMLMGSVFALLNPAHGTFQAQPETADLQQRLRVGVDVLASAIRTAGAGSFVGGSRGPLVRSLPPVLPYRIGETDDDPAGGVWFRPDVVSLISVPRTGAQATLRDGAAQGAAFVRIQVLSSCPPTTATAVCGFGPGTRALIYDGRGAWDLVTVVASSGDLLQVTRPGGLGFRYEPGAIVTEVVLRSYALRVDATGVPQLYQSDGFHSNVPVVDNVVSLEFAYFGDPQPPTRLASTPLDNPIGPWTTYGPRPPPVDVDNEDDSWPHGENCVFQVADGEHVPRLATLGAAGALVPLTQASLTDGPWCPDAARPSVYDADVLRIRRVRVRLRLQVASAGLRGAAGMLFRFGGHSTSAERFVPDQQIEFDVASPNLALGR